MPRRGLAGLVLLVIVVQMVLAPPIFACVAHHAGGARQGTIGECQHAASAEAAEVVASDAGAVPSLASTLAPAHFSHHQHHDQGCCAAVDACRGVFFPARATELERTFATPSLASATTIAPTARRAAPDSPPPKR